MDEPNTLGFTGGHLFFRSLLVGLLGCWHLGAFEVWGLCSLHDENH